MGIARDISKIFSTSTSLATDTEISAFNYLTQSSASSTYLTQTSASSIYQAIANDPTIFRNLVINGDFNIWQRGTSFTDLSAGNFYGPDRFGFNRTGDVSGHTISRSTDAPTGFNYSLKNQRTASNSNTAALATYYSAESLDSKRFAGKTFTFSFYAKAGANYSGGVLSYTVYSGTGTDQRVYSFTGSATPISSQASLTSSWQRFSASATFASNINQIGFVFAWTPTGTAGADDSVYITGIQLEEGPLTPFEFKPFGIELSRCQRYYEKSFDINTAPSNGGASTFSAGAGLNSFYTINGSTGAATLSFKVTKRGTPVLTPFGNSSGFWGYATGNGNLTFANSTFAAQDTSQYGARITQQVVNATFILICGHWVADAEL